MKAALLSLLLPLLAAQTPPPPSPPALPLQDAAALPSMTVGIGPSWTRGDAHAVTVAIDMAKRLGSSNAFFWSAISTPVAKVPKGEQPLASTFSAGLGYILAQTPGGRVSLVGIVLGGVNSVPTTGVVSPAFSGSLGAAIRLRKGSGLYFMPMAIANKPQKGTDGALVSAILQPGFRLIYGFGGK
jgi:hypothetical protein